MFSMPEAPSTEELTARALRRILPTFTQLTTLASFSHLYHGTTDPRTGEFQWTRAGIEGTAFLCATTGPPTIVIMNRRAMMNFIWPLDDPDSIELLDDGIHIVIPTSGAEEIAEIDGEERGVQCWGIWIYSQEGTSTAGAHRAFGEKVLRSAKTARTAGGGETLRKEQTQRQEPEKVQLGGGSGKSLLDMLFHQARRAQEGEQEGVRV